MDAHEQLLHDIDKRLAVIEAVNHQHARQTEEQFEHLEQQLDEVQKELGKLKFKIAGVASTVSAVIAAGASWWSG